MWCAQAEEELTAIIRSATTSWLRTLLTQQLDEESDGAAPEEGVVDECADRLTTTAIEEIFKHFSLQARTRTHAHAARAHDRRPVRPMLAAQYEATVQKWLDKNEVLAAKVMQSVRARAQVGACVRASARTRVCARVGVRARVRARVCVRARMRARVPVCEYPRCSRWPR
jgi:hypothetical protein